jgi:hypothetical protein
MKHLTLSMAVGILVCFAAAAPSEATAISGALSGASPTVQPPGIVDQVHWRRHHRWGWHHHHWWRHHHHRMWW